MHKANTLALTVALAFACLFLAMALWTPIAGFPLAAIFLVAAYGIRKGRVWSAYGGALLLVALGSQTAVRVWGAPRTDAYGIGVIASIGVFVLAALALFRAGRRMPAAATPASRAVWIALAAAFFVFPQFCRAYVIASGSMENTILVGDQVLVRSFAGDPARGDVVQFRYPVDPKQSFLKRVVAVGGDRVRLRDKQLFVNGNAVHEPYAVHRTEFTDAFRDDFPAGEPSNLPRTEWANELRADTVKGELVVPPGKFFVLGDNRDDSLDSRYFGFLERGDIIGRPMLIYFSAAAPEGLPGDPASRPPVLLHPSRIRWARMFKGL